MREKTFHVYVDSHDRSLLLQSLVELKNLLIQQGRYTDCVDELIFKVINAPYIIRSEYLFGGSYHMDEREKIIRLWFDMWLNQQDLGIDDIFTDDLIYIESWGPKYENRELLKHWFNEWNTRGKVLIWDIKC